MSPEGIPERPAREIRVEGGGLLVLGGALLVLVVGAFFVGVWVGRGSPETENGAGLGIGTPAESPPEATATPGYFDTGGDRKSAEPEREVKPPSRASSAPGSPAPPPPSPGTYFVQVFAGRDRRAAEVLVKTLTDRGYPVRLDTQREGRDALFKVRVGGYLTQDQARATADRLKGEGETGAWVTQVR